MTTGILHSWSEHSDLCTQCAAPLAGSVADDCHPGGDAAEPEDGWAALRATVEAITRADETDALGRADLDAAYQRPLFETHE